jgi:predicted membrane protein
MSRENRSQHRVVFGILVILVGTLALLDNLHVFDAREVIHFWPMVFVVFGVLKIFQARDVPGRVLGGALVAIGVAITLRNMGYLTIRWRDWWPVLLIAGGVFVIVNGKFGRRENGEFGAVEFKSSADAVVDVGVLMSGVNMANAAPDFKGGRVSAIAGGVEIDLRNASIESGAALNVFVFMGGIEIKVPNDWSVVCNVSPVLGGIDNKTVPPANAAKRLVITGQVVMGAVEVRN